jgi:signal transduction histidine kinase
VDLKIWRPDGTIAYSKRPDLIGQKMEPGESLSMAASGVVAAEFDHLSDEENVSERALNMPLLEIYSPIRESGTERIIAIAEIYQAGDHLAGELRAAQFQAALVVGGLSFLMLAALIGIVRRGSQIIGSQKTSLNERILELSRSLAINEELTQRVADANRRASESGERFLRRVSAELHDGPVQLIGLSLLRLDGLTAPKDAGRARETSEVIRSALQDALSEIRGLSNGMALPELETLSLEETLELAISNHERRSSTSVAISLPHGCPSVPASVKTCAYRFVQEGLNNAFRHAAGAGQQVALSWDGKVLAIEVSDAGPGLAGSNPPSSKSGLGLVGMRDRIESLGGSMEVTSGEDGGTRLRASFHLVNI